MPGLFSRIKNWVSLENLTNEDLNDEFNNILTNFTPDKMDDWSSTVGQMQAKTSPGSLGSESQATSVAGEIERLRYQLSAIIGKTHWYQAPDVSLTDAFTAINLGLPYPRNRIVSGKVSANNQPLFLTPSGSTTSITLSASSTPFVYVIDGTTYTISSDVTLTSLTTSADPTNAANQVAVNDPWFGSNTMVPKIAPEHGWIVPLDTIGGNIAATSGRTHAWRYGSSGDFGLGTYSSGSAAMVAGNRGYFYDSSGNFDAPSAMNDNATIQLHKLGYLFVTTAGGLAASYVEPTYSGTAPTSPSIGDYWFDIVNDTWKIYSGVSWDAANAMLIGIFVTNATACIRARSFDFWAPYRSNEDLRFVVNGSSEVLLANSEASLSLYGSVYNFRKTQIKWVASDIDGGGGFVNNTQYFLYITDGGLSKISTINPNLRDELGGYYHPGKPWLCVGAAYYKTTLGFQKALPIRYFLDWLAVDGHEYAFGLNPNGHGSTNNKIRRFSTLDFATNSCVYLIDSAADGASFTIKRDGCYAMSYSDGRAGSNENLGISKNSTQLTTSVGSITYTDLLVYSAITSNLSDNVAVTVWLRRGDVIRAHTNGGADSTGNAYGLRVVRVA